MLRSTTEQEELLSKNFQSIDLGGAPLPPPAEDLKTPNDNGWNALHHAAACKEPDLARIQVLATHISPHITTIDNETPLFLAIASGNMSVIEFLGSQEGTNFKALLGRSQITLLQEAIAQYSIYESLYGKAPSIAPILFFIQKDIENVWDLTTLNQLLQVAEKDPSGAIFRILVENLDIHRNPFASDEIIQSAIAAKNSKIIDHFIDQRHQHPFILDTIFRFSVAQRSTFFSKKIIGSDF